MVSPTSCLSPKRKKFLVLICEGHEPEYAAVNVWPKLTNVPEQVARVMADEKFKAAYAYLTQHKSSKEYLIQKCTRIAADDEGGGARVHALKLAAQIAGHINMERAKPGKTKQPKNDTMAEKLFELAKKAETHGHQKQAVS